MIANINYCKEHKWSLKIIAGKIREKLPLFFYKIIVLVRYVFFRKNCLNQNFPSLKYSDGSWVARGTTKDLRNIQAYLAQGDTLIKVMQAGIGNSSLFNTIKDRVTKLVGITIVPEELDYARMQFSNEFGTKYEVHLVNKYTNNLSFLGNGFDVIVDNDLSSYACCKRHFYEMLDAYCQILKKDGVILAGINGLGYFDSGFGLTERMAKKIFTEHGLVLYKTKVCYELRLAVDKIN